MKTLPRISAVAGISCLLFVASSPAAVWVGGNNDNDWNTAANWNPATSVPTGEIVEVNTGTAILSSPAPSITQLRVGHAVGTEGRLVVSSDLTITANAGTEIARSGTGTLIINSGANIQQTGNTSATFRFGVLAGSLGIGQQNGGSVTATGSFTVGFEGIGNYALAGGSLNARNNISIGQNLGGVGVYTQSSGTLTSGIVGAGGSVFVGQNGTGTLNLSGGRITASLMSIAGGAAAAGTVNQTGGTIDLVNGPNQSGMTNGQLTLTERGSYSISGGELSVKSMVLSGDFNITGAEATISVVNNFSLAATGTISFAFDAVGVTSIDIGGNGLFDLASGITVDGSAYAGATGTFILIDAITFNNTPVINLVGFGAGSSFNWDTANGVFSVTVVPEPGTVSLLLGGGLLLGWMGYRRRKA